MIISSVSQLLTCEAHSSSTSTQIDSESFQSRHSPPKRAAVLGGLRGGGPEPSCLGAVSSVRGAVSSVRGAVRPLAAAGPLSPAGSAGSCEVSIRPGARPSVRRRQTGSRGRTDIPLPGEHLGCCSRQAWPPTQTGVLTSDQVLDPSSLIPLPIKLRELLVASFEFSEMFLLIFSFISAIWRKM